MALLFEDDYQILKESFLEYEEDDAQRFFVIKNFPLPLGLYSHGGTSLDQVEILCVIPANYNTSGGDMFWVYPPLVRADGKAIPNVAGFGGPEPKHFKGKEYCRWSRHWTPESWKSKVDNIQKILDRLEWALRKPDAKA